MVIHEAGYTHQDIKPDNFRIHQHVVKILDFGLTSEYIQDGKHKSMGRFGLQVTPQTSAIKTLEGYNIGRRDDLESLGYTFMYLIDAESVPWKGVTDQQEILRLKKEFISDGNVDLKYRKIHKFILLAHNMDFDA